MSIGGMGRDQSRDDIAAEVGGAFALARRQPFGIIDSSTPVYRAGDCGYQKVR